MLRLSLLAFALLATGVAVAQNNPGNPIPPTPVPGTQNPQPPLAGNSSQPPADPNSSYATAPPTFAPGADSPRVRGPVRVSGGVMQGEIVSRVEPVYPAKAKSERLQGAVVLTVRIGKDGTVQDLQAISGPPALCAAAIDAVKQWTYKPYLLNGQAVEVQTTVTVHFQLNEPARIS